MPRKLCNKWLCLLNWYACERNSMRDLYKLHFCYLYLDHVLFEEIPSIILDFIGSNCYIISTFDQSCGLWFLILLTYESWVHFGAFNKLNIHSASSSHKVLGSQHYFLLESYFESVFISYGTVVGDLDNHFCSHLGWLMVFFFCVLWTFFGGLSLSEPMGDMGYNNGFK